MTSITLKVDPDQMDSWIAQSLRECYEDACRFYSREANHEKLADALLTVLEHYMSHNDFETWYESIKEL